MAFENLAPFSRVVELINARRRVRELVLTSPAFSISIGLLFQGLERDYTINSRRSLRDLKMRWHRHLKKVFSSLPAESLTTLQVSSYVTQRLAEKAAPATINRELALLKRCYRLAVREGILKLSDVPFFPMLRECNVRKGFMPDSLYPDLARETAKGGLYLRALFEIGLEYGWRKGELITMRVEQVDMAERTIVLHAGETKNDEARTIEMTRTVHDLLQGLIAGKEPGDRIFTRGKKNRPILCGFNKAWRRATLAAGCPGLLFHDLRRTAVRNMVNAGVPEKVAMEVTGHKTRGVFDRYHIVSPADLHRAVALMDVAAFRRSEQQAQLPFEAEGPPRKPAAVDHRAPARDPAAPLRAEASAD
jgi:integrase